MRPVIAALLVAACTAQNPAYDQPTTTPGGPTDTSAGTTPTSAPSSDTTPPPGSSTGLGGTGGTASTGQDPGSTGDTGVGPTTAPSTSTDSTLDPDTTDSSDPTTLTTSGVDLCMGQCGKCDVCMDGSCVKKPTGSPCVGAPEPGCEDLVFGLSNGQCLTYQAVGSTCDPQGQCIYDCQLPGVMFTGCTESCVSPMHNCLQGNLVGDVSLNTMCILNAESDGCQPYCTVMDDKPYHHPYQCNQFGLCEYKPGQQMTNCFPGSCQPDIGCTFGCMSSSDCAKFASCVNNVCTSP